MSEKLVIPEKDREQYEEATPSSKWSGLTVRKLIERAVCAEARVSRLSAPLSPEELIKYHGHGRENGRPMLLDSIDFNLIMTDRIKEQP
jgi:hypothetical protein